MAFYTSFPDRSDKIRCTCNLSAHHSGQQKLAHWGMLLAMVWAHPRPTRKPTPLAWVRWHQGGRRLNTWQLSTQKIPNIMVLSSKKPMLMGCFGGETTIRYRFWVLVQILALGHFSSGTNFCFFSISIMDQTTRRGGLCMAFYTIFLDLSNKIRCSCDFLAQHSWQQKLAHGGMLLSMARGHRLPARKPTPLAPAKGGGRWPDG